MRRRLLPILASLAGASLVGLLVYGVSAQSASRTLDELVAVGKRPAAPDAAHLLPRLGSAGHSSLAALKGKVVLLNFWASWCPPCKAEAPLLQRAQGRLEQAGATVLGVTYEDASPDSQGFVRRYHLAYPNLRDSDGGFARSYGTDQLPESFIVDRRGDVVALRRGEIGQDFINRALAIAGSS